MARTGFSLEGRKELEDIISAEENFQYATITSGQASCNILSSCQAEAPSLRCDGCGHSQHLLSVCLKFFHLF